MEQQTEKQLDPATVSRPAPRPDSNGLPMKRTAPRVSPDGLPMKRTAPRVGPDGLPVKRSAPKPAAEPDGLPVRKSAPRTGSDGQIAKRPESKTAISPDGQPIRRPAPQAGPNGQPVKRPAPKPAAGPDGQPVRRPAPQVGPDGQPVKRPAPKPAAGPDGQPVRRPQNRPPKPSAPATAPKAPKPGKPKVRKPAPAWLRILISVVSLCLCLFMGVTLIFSSGGGTGSASAEENGANILDKFESYVTNRISSSLEGILSIQKQYWLSDSDVIAPMPKAENYGTATSVSEIRWLLDKAVETFGGKPLVLTEETEIWDQYPIHYYYDDTILTVAWKEVIDSCVYTFSEVKIAHPSQFRRFLAGGTFGSDKQYTTTEMSASVNAVLASSGDFYKFRRYGAVVYQGQLQRFEGHYVDTCFIDDKGDLLFKYRDELKTEAETRQFIEDNNIRFSLAFGPVVIENGESKVPTNVYALGEIKNRFSRTVLCQMGELHYMLVNVGGDGKYDNRHKLSLLADNLLARGVPKAYSLDGGQTAVIAMNSELVNRPDYGTQRKHSDIIYFATAIPEGG